MARGVRSSWAAAARKKACSSLALSIFRIIRLIALTIGRISVGMPVSGRTWLGAWGSSDWAIPARRRKERTSTRIRQRTPSNIGPPTARSPLRRHPEIQGSAPLSKPVAFAMGVSIPPISTYHSSPPRRPVRTMARLEPSSIRTIEEPNCSSTLAPDASCGKFDAPSQPWCLSHPKLFAAAPHVQAKAAVGGCRRLDILRFRNRAQGIFGSLNTVSNTGSQQEIRCFPRGPFPFP